MKNPLIAVVAFSVTVIVMLVHAQAAETGKWQGYLVDKQCAESVKEDADPKPFIQNHTKECALMASCKVKGYCLFTDNKNWLDFDSIGNQLAIKLLKTSKKNRGFYIEVIGTYKDKKLNTQSMKEIKEPNSF